MTEDIRVGDRVTVIRGFKSHRWTKGVVVGLYGKRVHVDTLEDDFHVCFDRETGAFEELIVAPFLNSAQEAIGATEIADFMTNRHGYGPSARFQP